VLNANSFDCDYDQESNSQLMIEMKEIVDNFLFSNLFKVEKNFFIDGFCLTFHQKTPPFRQISVLRELSGQNFIITSGLQMDDGTLMELFRVENIKDLNYCRKQLNLIILGSDQIFRLRDSYQLFFQF
jgi:hypothetical protein